MGERWHLDVSSVRVVLASLDHMGRRRTLVPVPFVNRALLGRVDNALHGIAERLFRAAGNHQRRSRMSGRGQLRAPRPLRALVLATGEEVARGHSLRARLLIVELKPGEVDQAVLTRSQRTGGDGQLAAALGGYLAWIAGRYEELQELLHERVCELRSRKLQQSSPVHARLPNTLAELPSGWEIWLRFASELGAISSDERSIGPAS